jgi:hypothetical protein
LKTDQQTTDSTMTPLAIVGIGSMFPDAENSAAVLDQHQDRR